MDLAEVVSDPTSKLILADELEAITEPGAGARIIAGMLLAAEAHPDTSMVLVTHLAPAIIEATGRDDLRIDGIEARGLDEDLELIVDRTPRRNHLARSTPELIVRRLVERSGGRRRRSLRRSSMPSDQQIRPVSPPYSSIGARNNSSQVRSTSGRVSTAPSQLMVYHPTDAGDGT